MTDAAENELQALLEEQAQALENHRLVIARLEARIRVLRNGRAPTIELMTTSIPQPGGKYSVTSFGSDH